MICHRRLLGHGTRHNKDGRRGRDSNPRTRSTPVTRFPVAPVQPLRHLSETRCQRAPPEGYDTARPAADRLPAVLAPILAANAAFSKDVGLIVTFIGIGILVNIIIVLIFVLVRGEYQQNREDRHR